jgi:hypothetical protein
MDPTIPILRIFDLAERPWRSIRLSLPGSIRQSMLEAAPGLRMHARVSPGMPKKGTCRLHQSTSGRPPAAAVGASGR